MIASPNGIFGVYSDARSVRVHALLGDGSGREFAIGAMHSQYDILKTAEAVAESGIAAGATFDKNSALPLTMFTVALK